MDLCSEVLNLYTRCHHCCTLGLVPFVPFDANEKDAKDCVLDLAVIPAVLGDRTYAKDAVGAILVIFLD